MSATVLIVEDNAFTRRRIAEALTASGLAVVEAPDAATALREVAGSIALVLLDVMLPDRDGIALAAELRAVRGSEELPILAVTGLLAKDDEARLADAGFDGFVPRRRAARRPPCPRQRAAAASSPSTTIRTSSPSSAAHSAATTR